MQTARLLALALTLLALPAAASAAPPPPSAPGPAPWVGAQLKGTEVIAVTPDSPAATAGLEVGDRVLSVDGLPTPTGEDVAAVVRDGRIGAFVVMRVARGKRQLALAVYLAARPGERAAPAPAPARDDEPYDDEPSGPYDDPERGGEPLPTLGDDDADDNATFDDDGWVAGGDEDPAPPTGWDTPDDPWSGSGDAGDDGAVPGWTTPNDPWRGPGEARGGEDLDNPWSPAPAEVAPTRPVAPQVTAVDLGRHRGEVVVVQFMATWCGACLAVQPQLEAMQRRYGAAGLRVVSVSSEAPSLLARHRDQHGFTGVFAHDAGDALAARHGVRSLPTIVVFDQDGRPRGRFIGGGGNVARVEGLVASLLNARRAPTRQAPRARHPF